MTLPRKQQVCLDSTPYYHCICRCVRKAFLCGEDELTKKNFDHRKQWLMDKITQLAKKEGTPLNWNDPRTPSTLNLLFDICSMN